MNMASSQVSDNQRHPAHMVRRNFERAPLPHIPQPCLRTQLGDGRLRRAVIIETRWANALIPGKQVGLVQWWQRFRGHQMVRGSRSAGNEPASTFQTRMVIIRAGVARPEPPEKPDHSTNRAADTPIPSSLGWFDQGKRLRVHTRNTGAETDTKSVVWTCPAGS